MTRRRILAMALILAMCICCLPIPALGTEESEGSASCSCSVPCAEDNINKACPVCGGESGNPAACTAKASESATCSCTTACTEDTVNDACPLCGGESGNPAACTAQVSRKAACICTSQCTADNVNEACPVCGGEDGVLTSCTGTSKASANFVTLDGLTIQTNDGSALTEADYSYSKAEKILTITSGRAMTLSGTTSTCRVVIAGGVSANVTLNSVCMTPGSGAAVALGSGASLALTLEGNSTLTGSEGYAGLRVCEGTSATISGSGSLLAGGGTRGAGIGGNEYENCGTVTILGGSIHAEGGSHAAGIGGGILSDGGNVGISGGSVTAIGGQFASGIGGSGAGSAGNVRISGGSVTATGGSHGAGIGCGALGSTGSVIISGGSIHASSISGTPTNDSGQSVSLTVITLDGLSTASVNDITAVSSDSDSYAYGTAGTQTTSGGTLYLYLPSDVTVTGITAGGVSYSTGDGISGGGEVTLHPKQTPNAEDFNFAAPEDLFYNGSEKAAAVTTQKTGMGSITMHYYAGSTELSAAPTGVGSYTVKIDVAAGSNYTAASGLTRDDWCFEILPAPVTALELTQLLPSPEKGLPPCGSLTHSQYTGSVVWTNNPTVFLGGTVYSARLVLTPTENYSFSGSDSWTFRWNEETLSAETGSDGTVSLSITFPATAPREATGISISQAPTKTLYDIGESFDPQGMTVTATYDDGTSDAVTEGLRFQPEIIAADTRAVTVSLGDASTQVPITIADALKSITAPDAIDGLTNGTAKTAEALGLPETVGIVTDGGEEMTASVVWDLSDCAYIEAEPGQQSFTVAGSVRLPEALSNRNQVPLTVSVSVSVKAATILSGFPARDTSPGSTDTDEEVSGIAENQEFPLGDTLDLSIQSVRRGKLSYVPAKWSTNPSGFFESTGGDYTATINTAAMAPGSHVLSLFYQETDSTTGIATGNVVITEIHYSLQSLPANSSNASTTPSIPTYIVTASAGSGGRITPGGRIAVDGGGSVSFRITPSEGYVIDDVTVDGKSIGAVDSYTFKEIWANHTISASFRGAQEAPSTDAATQPPEQPTEAPRETIPYPTLPPVSASRGSSIPMYVPLILLLLAFVCFGAAILIYRWRD